MSQPRRLRARKPACVQTRQRNPSSFGSNVQPRPRGIASGSGEHRFGQPQSHPLRAYYRGPNWSAYRLTYSRAIFADSDEPERSSRRTVSVVTFTVRGLVAFHDAAEPVPRPALLILRHVPSRTRGVYPQ